MVTRLHACVACSLLLLLICFPTNVNSFARKPRSTNMQLPYYTNLLFASMMGANRNVPIEQSTGGGVNCAGCTGLVAIVEQYADTHNKPIIAALKDLCALLPNPLVQVCDDAAELYGPVLINMLELHQTPDRVCKELGVCTNGTCALFPPPKKIVDRSLYAKHVEQFHKKANSGILDEIVKRVEKTFNDHVPLIDLDNDKFSTFPTFRGTSWRGKDCSDLNKNIYPGRNFTRLPPSIDHNCNGISGVDDNGVSLEQKLCGGTPYYAYHILGDSAAAHFHFPPEYLTPATINANTFTDILPMLVNEFDFPEMSATTGFTETNWIGKPEGPVSSSYLYAKERNRCVHRDYQNMGVNGARTGAMANNIVFGYARDQQNDFPVNLMYALIGNDVCNGHPGLGRMTTTDQFYDNVVKAMEYLDTQLPAGSHVMFLGLAEGTILYDAMHDRLHPIGQLRGDVTYEDLYNYLNCLEISPCWGWLNSDAYWRQQTQHRADQLSDVYNKVIANNKYKNFNMTYFKNPIKELVKEWENKGGQAWQLIEPADGFHPNQLANYLTAEWQWSEFKSNYTYLLNPINPNNHIIDELFGDQGGY